MKIVRRLAGYGPKPLREMNVEIEVPAYLWPVALALADAVPGEGDPAMVGAEWPITEAKARALAMAMGCVIPPEHQWSLAASKPKREMQVIADPLFHHRV